MTSPLGDRVEFADAPGADGHRLPIRYIDHTGSEVVVTELDRNVAVLCLRAMGEVHAAYHHGYSAGRLRGFLYGIVATVGGAWLFWRILG